VNAKPTAAFTSTVADLKASVDASGATDSDRTVAGHAWDFADGATGRGKLTSHTYTLPRTYSVVLTVTDNHGANDAITPSATVTGRTYTAGTVLHLRMQAVGSGSTDLKLKVWKDGTAEPSTWQVTATDTTASLQSAKGVGIMGFLSTSATNSPVTLTIDNLLA